MFWVKDQAGTSDSRNMLPFEVKSVLEKKKKKEKNEEKKTSTSLNFVCKQICVWKVEYP